MMTLGELAKELHQRCGQCACQPCKLGVEAAERLEEVAAILLGLQKAGSIADYIGDGYEDGPAKAKARTFVRAAIEGKEP